MDAEAYLRNARSIAERLLGRIEWASTDIGACRCPGEIHHTAANKDSDCTVYLNQVPTIHCFHNSCNEEILGVQRQLRGEISRSCGSHPHLPKRQEGHSRILHCSIAPSKDSLRHASQASLDLLFNRYPWTSEQIILSSPCNLVGVHPNGHWRDLLALFDVEDVVWIGRKFDSRKGDPRFSRYFQSVKQWLHCARAPDQFTCPTTFKAGSFSRCNANAERRRFLVVESDTLNRDHIGSIFQWLRFECGLRLRAVIDTAGKSLHGWFDFPCPEMYKRLERVLPHLECDPALFRMAQPVRLPGAIRGTKFQRLIYLDKDPK